MLIETLKRHWWVPVLRGYAAIIFGVNRVRLSWLNSRGAGVVIWGLGYWSTASFGL